VTGQQSGGIPHGLNKKAHEFTLRYVTLAAQIHQRKQPQDGRVQDAFSRHIGIMHMHRQAG
jgi:hypothetical protein